MAAEEVLAGRRRSPEPGRQPGAHARGSGAGEKHSWTARDTSLAARMEISMQRQRWLRHRCDSKGC